MMTVCQIRPFYYLKPVIGQIKNKQYLCSHDAISIEYFLEICLQIYFSQSDTYNMVSLCVQMLSVFLQDKGINACDHCIKIMLHVFE